ncbi:hypothetical protein ABMY47_09175 [Pseudoalteromonas sp. BZP1]|uniref:hypothetical protein n=1 Tax=unclassified Pseudoalteromonas TaxID=194690 RepID=UPI0032C4A162
MAKSKWTDSSSVNELLSRIEKLKLKDGQQCGMIVTKKSFKSAFNSRRFDNYLMLLKELVRFDSEVPDAVKEQILHDAVWHAADMEQLQSGYIGGQIKKLEAEYLAKESKKYYLITAVSITGLKSKRLIKTPKSIITISKYFPKKFKKSYDFQEVHTVYPKINQKCYSWVVIEVCARCEHAAAEVALEQLDYWRGIFNIFFNHNNTRTSFGKPAPINKITKYPYHSLHMENGDKASPFYWFDPNFSYETSSLDVSKSYERAKVFYHKLSSGIEDCGSRKFFLEILNRYCVSLDTANMNSSFLAMWSLLESLTFTGKENYDVTIARTLILFKDKFHLRLELELLRKKRNMAIHNGQQFEEAEKYAYLLMNIIHEYIFFLVVAIRKSKSIEQLTSALDLPPDKAKLLKARQQLDDEIKKLDLLESLIRIEG